MGVMAASEPPQIMMSVSPRWIILKLSPTAWALAEQAVAVAEAHLGAQHEQTLISLGLLSNTHGRFRQFGEGIDGAREIMMPVDAHAGSDFHDARAHQHARLRTAAAADLAHRLRVGLRVELVDLTEPEAVQAAIRRGFSTFDSGGAKFMLDRADAVRAVVTALEDGYLHVTLTASLRATRGGYIGGLYYYDYTDYYPKGQYQAYTYGYDTDGRNQRESLFALLGEECPQCSASGRVLSRERLLEGTQPLVITLVRHVGVAEHDHDPDIIGMVALIVFEESHRVVPQGIALPGQRQADQQGRCAQQRGFSPARQRARRREPARHAGDARRARPG